MDGFVSPVSKLRQVESDALRRQQQRMQALEQEAVAARAAATKRKASEATSSSSATGTIVLDAAARAAARRKKKQRRETLDLNEVEREEADMETEKMIKRLEADMDAMNAAAKVILQPTPSYDQQQDGRVVEEGDAHALPLFSRVNDPSVRASARESRSVSYAASSSEGSSSSSRRRLKHFDSLNILRENIAVRDEEDEDEDGSPSKSGLLPRPGVLLPSVMDEEFIDLDKIPKVSMLETVEGSAILDVLMNTSSVSHRSRVTTRKAYHKEVHDASEEREREFLRRRRLALRNRMPSVVQRANANWDRDYKEEELEDKLSQEQDTEEDEEEEEADDRIEAIKEAEESQEQEAVEAETMQSKMQDVQQAKQVHWKRTLVRIAVGTSALCAVIAAAAVVPILLAPSVPYCNTTDAGNEVVASKFDHSMDLQPYMGDAGSSSCRSCPVYAHCSDGKVVSCQPSYELHSGNCVESAAINHDLRQVAAAIGQFVTKQATEHVCNTSFWSSVFSADSTAAPLNETKSPSRMLLSDLYDFMTSSLAFGPAASVLPREYVFSRALDIALRDLSDISVDDEEHLIIGDNVTPLLCRARNQLYEYAPTIVLVVLTAIVMGVLYQQIAIYRAKQALVDRLVKEVRAFLLARTAKAERFYPGEHLRDYLFDALPATSLDRAWLRRVVWPKVVAVVKEDSRIRCRNATIEGQQVAVWEWVSSTSPPVKKLLVGRIGVSTSKQQVTVTKRTSNRSEQKTKVARRSARFVDDI